MYMQCANSIQKRLKHQPFGGGEARGKELNIHPDNCERQNIIWKNHTSRRKMSERERALNIHPNNGERQNIF